MDESIPEEDWAAAEGIVGTVLPPLRMLAANAVKSVASYTGLHRIIFYRYDYMFRPRNSLFSCRH